MYKAESVYMQKFGDYERLPNNTSGTCGLKNSTDFQSSSAFFFSRYLNDDRRWALARSVSGRANLTWKTKQHKNIFESVFSTHFPHVSQHSEYILSVVKLQQSLIPKKNSKWFRSLIYTRFSWTNIEFMVKLTGMSWWFVIVTLKCSVTLFFHS